jgi:hypothetical protein
MKIERRGPASLPEVVHSIEQMEHIYRMSTESFMALTDPTALVPEDEASRWIFLIEQREALDTHEGGVWTPNYARVVQHGSARLPEVDREAVECGVAA